MNGDAIWMMVGFFAIAVAYASVGQAGATGYIAIMAFAGSAPVQMKVTALALNLMVAGIGTLMFLRAGHLPWRRLRPFAVFAVPASVLGGATRMPEAVFATLIGVILIGAAIQMTRSAVARPADLSATTRPSLTAAAVTGLLIGGLSGATGTGGGVFLAPLLLAMNWATPRETGAMSAMFNLMISAAALLGAVAQWDAFPRALPLWLLVVAGGGALGAAVGSRYLPDVWLRLILAAILLASGIRMVIL